MENYLGEIKIFPYTYMPQDWIACDGRLVPIQAYQALYAIIGTKYGGDGKSTFGIPDLRGSVIMGTQTISDAVVTGGTETQALGYNDLATHNHTLNVNGFNHNNQVALASYTPKNTIPLTNTFLYNNTTATNVASYATTGNIQMSAAAISVAGGTVVHENRMPVLTLNIGIYTIGGSWPYNNN